MTACWAWETPSPARRMRLAPPQPQLRTGRHASAYCQVSAGCAESRSAARRSAWRAPVRLPRN